MIDSKLDLLMNVTNTKNSTLAKVLKFDASYIGRIRLGKRSMPKNLAFLEPAAQYFVRHAKEPYQQKIFAAAICPDKPWPTDSAKAEALVLKWMQEERDSSVASLEAVLRQMRFDSPAVEVNQTDVEDEFSCYYGNSGKRQAVLRFLTDAAEQEKPQTLLLYSSEDMAWLYEDRDFVGEWRRLMIAIMSKGGMIHIVHTITRNINEMMEAVQKWLPLYLTGRIRPYFYPRLLDEVHHRTIFITAGRSAVISNSIMNHTNHSLNLLLTNPKAVQALMEEYQDFLALCRPLMETVDLRNTKQFWGLRSDFDAQTENLVLAHSSLSIYTMPEQVIHSVAARLSCPLLLNKHRIATGSLRKILDSNHRVTELIRLPDPELVKAGKIPVPLSDLYGTSGNFTAEEYRMQLEYMLQLAEQEKNYSIAVTEQLPPNLVFLSKESFGTLVSRSVPPSTVFFVHEQRMAVAFYDYIHRVAESCDPKKSFEILKEYIAQL